MGRTTLVRELWGLVYFLTVFPLTLHPPIGGFQQLLLEPVLKFHYMLKKLQLHKEEYVLMQAISLFSPGEASAWPARPPCTRACSLPFSFTCGWRGGSSPSSTIPGKILTNSFVPSHCTDRMGTPADFPWVGGPHTTLVALPSFLCLGVLALEGGCQTVCPLRARLSLSLPPWP